jgi:WD40 repeat protein
MNRPRILARLGLVFLVSCFCETAWSQQQCPAPAILNPPPGANIFTEQQEVDLGDVIAEQFERNYRVIHDNEQAAFLNQAAARILAQMPPTALRIRVMLIDLPILNAFSLPGGRIYVSRKMVAFLQNDDELAGLLGHEMGHILTHQGGIRMTRLFREVLGVTTVGDRKDIFDKFNQLADNAARNPKAFQPDKAQEEPHQYQADEVGLYAVSNAGYSTQAFVDFFDRLAQTQGKTGSFLTDLIGHSKPNEKRLREMHKSLDGLPVSCKRFTSSQPSAQFLTWQSAIVAYSGLGRKEVLAGVIKKQILEPPLRTDLSHLKFGPDGRYVLAQDDSSVFVLSRDPFSVLFRIDASEAHAAQFTPDSQGVVFDTRGMRVEEWNIAEAKRTSVQEVTAPAGCLQTLLAPDGKTLACFNSHFDISLIDVATSKTLFEKKAYFLPSGPYADYAKYRILAMEEIWNVPWVHMAYSPDLRYFIAANAMNRIAVDMATHSPVSLHGGVADMVGGGFVFLSADRIVAQDRLDRRSSAIVSFPAGAVLRKFPSTGQELKPATHGDYVVLSNVKDARAGVMDLNTQKIYTGPTKLAALDAYDQHFLAEKSSGEIGVWDLVTGKLEAKTSLPRSPLGFLRTWAVSPDLKWLAVSASSRGAVWDLSTAKRLYYTRGFRGSYFDSDQILYADYPKLDTVPRAVALLDLGGKGLAEGISVSENFEARQYGQYLVLRKPAGNKELLSTNVTLEVQNIRDGHSLWTRNFPKEAPRITVNPEADRMVLSWLVSEESAKNEVKTDSSLQGRLAAMQERDGAYLLEVLELRTGNVLGKLLVDTGKGSFRLRGAQAAGDWVLLPDNENRTLVYSLSTGEKKATLFGSRSVISTAAGLLAIENESGQLDIYALQGFEKSTQLNFSSNISVVTFSEAGDRLFVLTSDQTAYILDSTALARDVSTQAAAR